MCFISINKEQNVNNWDANKQPNSERTGPYTKVLPCAAVTVGFWDCFGTLYRCISVN